MKNIILILLLSPLLSTTIFKKTPLVDESPQITNIGNLVNAFNSHYPISSFDEILHRFDNRIRSLFFSAHYYVTNVAGHNGNDANNGTSPATPWLTLSKVQSTTHVAGDTISLECGSIFREAFTAQQSGSAGNPIVFNTWGTGVNPIISGSVVLNSGWTAFGSNIWKRTLATVPNVVLFNNVIGHRVATTAEITAPNYWAQISGVLYVFSTGDPAITYTAPGVEAGSLSRCVLHNSKTDYDWYNITFRDGNNGGGGQGNVRVGTRWRFFTCISERGGGAGFEVDAGSGFEMHQTTVRINRDYGLVYATMTASIIDGCAVIDNGWGVDWTNSQISGIQGDLGGLTVSNSEIARNANGTTKKAGQCHGIYNSTANTGLMYAINNNIHDNGQGAGIKTYCNSFIYGNIFSGNAYESLEVASTGTTDMVCWFVKNQCSNSTLGFPAVSEVAKATGKISLNCYNNTIYKMGQTGQYDLLIGDAVDTVRIKNCAFIFANGRPAIRLSTTIVFKDLDYNYYGGGAFENRITTTSYTSLSAWATAVSGESHSIANVTDTSMISPPSNMTPTPTSVLKNAGTTITGMGLTCNGAACDIGAIELGSVPPKPAVPVFNTSSNRIRYPTLTGTLDGSGSHDDDGTITAYQWKFISGNYKPTFSDSTLAITNITWPASASTSVIGTYIFQLKVTDNDNLSDSIQVKFFVGGGFSGSKN